MPSQRTQAKQRVQEIRDLIWTAFQRPVLIEFGPHKLHTTILDIILAKQDDIINLPDKRINDQQKLYTPSLFTLQCADGKLHFVIEDLEDIIVLTQSIQIMMKGGLMIRIVYE